MLGANNITTRVTHNKKIYKYTKYKTIYVYIKVFKKKISKKGKGLEEGGEL
jgi:hypothetical protein